MNKADSERFGAALESIGFEFTDDLAEAEVIIVNSCSVRESAEQRVLGKLGSLKRLKAKRPDVVVILAGCMVGEDQGHLARRLAHVDAFIRPSDVEGLIDAVRRRISQQPTAICSSSVEPALSHLRRVDQRLDSRTQHSSRPNAVAAWVPIVYGCNNFCSYCIVPYRRGRERSRPMEEVLIEIRGLVARGVREVTLLGQNVDSYGRGLPGRPDLADLLHQIQQIEGLCRVRFLTSHPKDMTDKLMQAVASLPKVCEHINLPVQHGDDDILRSMRRGYTAQQYRDLVARLRSFVPEVSLSTDVIVGYPGETEKRFQRTYDLLSEIRFDVVHAAMYSPRPGTRAASLPDDVPLEEKKRRLATIELLQEKIARESNQRLIGATVEILVEDLHRGKWQGRTRTNKLVFVTSDRDLRGQLVGVTIEGGTAWSLQGVLADRLSLAASC